ncbi:MAG: cell division FtsA domain-containing protein, partial [Bacteroidales bacterium]
MQKKIDGTVVAIDLGSSKIKVMAAIGSEEYYEVVFHEERKSQGIINGEVVNIKSVAESLSPIISKIKEEFPSPIARIAIGITGYNLRSYTIKERVSRKEPNHIISNNEIEELIEKVRKGGEKRGEVVLDVIPQNYNVDDNMGVDQASGMTGTNIEGIFKVISLKERGYLNSHKLAEYMKLEEYWLTLSPVAAAEGVLTPDEFDLGAVLLNIGAENVEMVICHNNKVREVAIIPFGGGSITKDISHFCGITFDKAERVKCEEGSCISNSIIEEDTILLEGSSGIEREVEKRS